jgi:superfamily II RNA helicase
MTEGLLEAVFATSTVAAGVNFPARTVVFLNSDRFNGREFLPLSPTEFHQMTGRAGRRGKDHIGFALAIPGKFMDVRFIGKLINSPPSDVVSQIKINFSMVLNLLLSHTPEQIEELLEKSFAAFLLLYGRKNRTYPRQNEYDYKHLGQSFLRHLNFLEESGYVGKNGKLTDDGIWASQLRIDQPLMIAEGFRLGLFPTTDPAALAGIVAAFVNEQPAEDRIDKKWVPKALWTLFHEVERGLSPFARQLFEKKFDVRPIFLRPVVAMHAWAAGESWEKVLLTADTAEGDLAMLILRTAENLRHIRTLGEVFPEAAQTAKTSIELILRDPVVTG